MRLMAIPTLLLYLGAPVGAQVSRDSAGYVSPATVGGSMLTSWNDTNGLGEPLNVILSGESDPAVLVDSTERGGFQNYMLSLNLSRECMGLHLGGHQYANLDGQLRPEVQVLRWNFGNTVNGTCQQTLVGGLHLRYWVQNSTKAIFMAASTEMNLTLAHNIISNGYNIGRDEVVGNATGGVVSPRSVSNSSTFSGESHYGNYTYRTLATYVSNLLQNSSDHVNHYQTVSEGGYPAIDGLVAVLTVSIVNGSSISSTNGTATPTSTPPPKSSASLLSIPYLLTFSSIAIATVL